MKFEFSESQLKFLRQEVEQYYGWIEHEEINYIQSVLRLRESPAGIRRLHEEVKRWRALWEGPDAPIRPDVSFAPLLKAVLLARRRQVAGDVDARRTKTLNPDALALLSGELAEYDHLAAEPWFRDTAALPIPRLADYLTLEEVEQVLQQRQIKLQDREFDEKFHLLQAPRLILPDLNYFRETSGVRGNSVALAFIDIDDFKRLNTRYGHHMVDEGILPIFMRCLEAFAFSRGYAYRMGGDEYVVIFGNGQGAEHTFADLLGDVNALKYVGVDERLTVSVGLSLVSPISELSDAAIYERANAAMRHAKTVGKNRIAVCRSDWTTHDDYLVIAKEPDCGFGVTAPA